MDVQGDGICLPMSLLGGIGPWSPGDGQARAAHVKQEINSLLCLCALLFLSPENCRYPSPGVFQLYPCHSLLYPGGGEWGSTHRAPVQVSLVSYLRGPLDGTVTLHKLLPGSRGHFLTATVSIFPKIRLFPTAIQISFEFSGFSEFSRIPENLLCLCPERSPLFLWAFCWNKHQWSSPQKRLHWKLHTNLLEKLRFFAAEKLCSVNPEIN